MDSSASEVRRPAKKQRRESSTSNSNRVGSISPALNHSTPVRKSGSTLLNRPANIARPVSTFYYYYKFYYFAINIFKTYISFIYYKKLLILYNYIYYLIIYNIDKS